MVPAAERGGAGDVRDAELGAAARAGGGSAGLGGGARGVVGARAGRRRRRARRLPNLLRRELHQPANTRRTPAVCAGAGSRGHTGSFPLRVLAPHRPLTAAAPTVFAARISCDGDLKCNSPSVRYI